jgi:DtxR family Mn-dependent transcriptional regulator
MPDPFISLLIAAVITGLGFLLLRSQRGWLARWQKTRYLTERVCREDALKYIHKCEMNSRCPTVESIAGALQLSLNETATLLIAMQASKLLQIKNGDIHLTPKGREIALHIIRVHRLWERHLAEETGFSAAEWHEQADRVEHFLSPAEADALSHQLGHPTYDPHGDPIPTTGGVLVTPDSQPLTAFPIDTSGRIVHLEDEPEIVYAQLVAEGLHPGMVVHLLESSPERVRFWANGEEHRLAPTLAMNISVVPQPVTGETTAVDSEPLDHLHIGETAVVVSLSPASRGIERRRLMDLGILPGTAITAEMRSPSGDPTAYLIREATIALRQEQARLIQVKRERR